MWFISLVERKVRNTTVCAICWLIGDHRRARQLTWPVPFNFLYVRYWPVACSCWSCFAEGTAPPSIACLLRNARNSGLPTFQGWQLSTALKALLCPAIRDDPTTHPLFFSLQQHHGRFFKIANVDLLSFCERAWINCKLCRMHWSSLCSKWIPVTYCLFSVQHFINVSFPSSPCVRKANCFHEGLN